MVLPLAYTLRPSCVRLVVHRRPPLGGGENGPLYLVARMHELVPSKGDEPPVPGNPLFGWSAAAGASDATGNRAANKSPDQAAGSSRPFGLSDRPQWTQMTAARPLMPMILGRTGLRLRLRMELVDQIAGFVALVLRGLWCSRPDTARCGVSCFGCSITTVATLHVGRRLTF